MSNFSDNIVNQRFKLVYDSLREDGKIRSKSDIAKSLGTYNHIINSILNGKRNLTLDQLNKLIDIYGVNANYLFGFSQLMFSDSNAVPALSIASKIQEGRQNIVLVPQKAMAGFSLASQDSVGLNTFVDKECKQRFSIPNMEGELLAFEISGDSMLPNITSGDYVICEKIERGEPIKDNTVYVIVTETVAAKRIQLVRENNQVQALRLISDNHMIYPPYTVDINEVRAIYKVKCRLTNYGIA